MDTPPCEPASSPSFWRLERDEEEIAWLYADNPAGSTNTLSCSALAELEEKLQALRENPPNGLVILSAKERGFIAGADVAEFRRITSMEEARIHITWAQSVFDHLERLPFPTVCLIHGFCLGGGLELALACDYRLAEEDPSTRIGLPEVRLGIHPGYGGSVRLPRLIGHLPAMEMMLAGRTLSARAAKRMGVVDHALPRRQLRRAARHLILKRPPPHRPPWHQRIPGAAPFRPLVARMLRRQVAKKVRADHYPAPNALIDLWQRQAGSPVRQWLEAEARSVAELVTGDTATNLIRVFFLQTRLKEEGRQEAFRVARVHVVGAGVMGGDIAAWCALRGVRVTLQDQTPERIAPAIQRAWKLFNRKLRKPRLVQAAMDRLQPDPHGHGIRRADLIVEAVFEDLEVKRGLFARLQREAREDALLATNTSSIPLEEIATVLDRPERLVGIHFFNPVAKMQLVEVVAQPDRPSPWPARAAAFVRQIDRLPLPVRSSPGFLVNRVLMPYLLEAVQLVEEGVAPGVVDGAARDFGMPMGPIELADTVGLDICLHVAEILADHLGASVPERLREMVEQGLLGRKSGAGFYNWQKGRPTARPGSDGERRLPREKIENRLMLRMLNEAVACLQAGVVGDADLLDAGMVFGTGFAPFRGGPMHYLQQVGTDEILHQLESLEQELGERFSPADGWDRLDRLLQPSRPEAGKEEKDEY
ncbi:MAG TPA: crotonase [Thiotrichales bacterium]|nr:crotonase [Thiotrichales bacterium]